KDRHFSSIGQMWMPWSMQFQGNFFIHGRTYYPDGTPTSSDFTGGCIRLSTNDAERVFRLVNVGTPVLVSEARLVGDSFTYETSHQDIASAATHLSGDLGNNHVFVSKDATAPVPIASITKLM